jgi:glucokinase
VRRSLRAATPVAGGAEASLDAMLALARELVADEPAERVGVGFGGPVAADGRTVRRSLHVAGWDGFPLADRVEAELRLPVSVANDGNAAALGEHRFGAGRSVADLLYVTASTGIGAGIVVGGRLVLGERAWAGELGHVVLEPDGPACSCGRRGCLEALASGPAIARAAGTGSARAVAEAAASGDAAARRVWGDAMRWLGLGIASAANLLGPGRVVVGGGLTNAGALFFDPVRAVVAERALDPELEVVPSALGDDVGVVGAAAVALLG